MPYPTFIGAVIFAAASLTSAELLLPDTGGCEPLSSVSATSGVSCGTQDVWAQTETNGVCPDDPCSFSDFKSTVDDCDWSQVKFVRVGGQVKPVSWSGFNTHTWTLAAITPDCGSAGPGGKAKYVTLFLLDSSDGEIGSLTKKLVCTACE